jgi:DNA/RNA endonuclease YhcR with UshA esterase domain
MRNLQAGAGIAAFRLFTFTVPRATVFEPPLARGVSIIMSRTSTVAVALLSAVFLTGCASAVRIAEIKTDPGRYSHKTVSVKGTVTSSFGVSLVPVQLYNIDDGTGEIAVLARSTRGVPSKGARVKVTGTLADVASFGGRSVGLHIDEQSRKGDY